MEDLEVSDPFSSTLFPYALSNVYFNFLFTFNVDFIFLQKDCRAYYNQIIQKSNKTHSEFELDSHLNQYFNAFFCLQTL